MVSVLCGFVGPSGQPHRRRQSPGTDRAAAVAAEQFRM